MTTSSQNPPTQTALRLLGHVIEPGMVLTAVCGAVAGSVTDDGVQHTAWYPFSEYDLADRCSKCAELTGWINADEPVPFVLTGIDGFTVDIGEDRSVVYRIAPVSASLGRNDEIHHSFNGKDRWPDSVAVRLDIDGWFDEVLMNESTGHQIDVLYRVIVALSVARDQYAKLGVLA